MIRTVGINTILKLIISEGLIDTDMLIDNFDQYHGLCGKLFDDCENQNGDVTEEVLWQYIGSLKIDFMFGYDDDPNFNYDELEFMDWIEDLVVSE